MSPDKCYRNRVHAPRARRSCLPTSVCRTVPPPLGLAHSGVRYRQASAAPTRPATRTRSPPGASSHLRSMARRCWAPGEGEPLLCSTVPARAGPHCCFRARSGCGRAVTRVAARRPEAKPLNLHVELTVSRGLDQRRSGPLGGENSIRHSPMGRPDADGNCTLVRYLRSRKDIRRLRVPAPHNFLASEPIIADSRIALLWWTVGPPSGPACHRRLRSGPCP